MTKDEKLDIFFEEVMPSEDVSEIMEVINNAIFEFKFGLSISEKSKLLSVLKEQEEAEREILQST